MFLRALSKCLFNTDRPGALTTSPGSLFQGLTTLWVTKCFLMSHLILPWCSFELFSHVLSLDPRGKSSAPPFPRPLLRKLQRPMRSSLSLLFSKLDKPRVLGHSSQDTPSSSSTSFVALLWTHSRTFTSFLNCGAQNCTQCSRRDRTNAKYNGTVSSVDRLAGFGAPPDAEVSLSAARARCWLTLSLLPASTPRSLSAGLLSSHSSCVQHYPVPDAESPFILVTFHATDDCPMFQSI